MRSREVYRGETVAILVDAFRHTLAYMKSCQEDRNDSCLASDRRPFCVLFFLSHFHSDHYNGITEGWNHGIIYASRGTANILCWRLGIPDSRVKRMDFCVTYTFSLKNGALLYETAWNEEDWRCSDDFFSVTLVPAGHCPGSVMFLFRSPVFGTVLHTGDFRFTQEQPTSCLLPHVPRMPKFQKEIDMTTNPILNSVAGKVDVLFLDNTFCDERFNFPSRADSLREVNEAILSMFREHTSSLQGVDKETSARGHEAKENAVSVAVLIGTYFIGKERIALSIQENFLPLCAEDSTCKVVPTYVSPEKYESLRQLEYYCDHFMALPRRDGEVKGEGSTLEVLTKHAVRLPQDTLSSSSKVARELFSSLDPVDMSSKEMAHYLTIFLVPLSSVTYPVLAAACGGRSKRRRSGSATEEGVDGSHQNNSTRGEVVSLWGDEKIDLKQFDGVLCVEPTGWTRKVRRQILSKRVTLLHVPYSEHSSFTELVDFVGFMNPARIVPTVSLELFQKYEVLFAEKAPRLRQRYSNVQPLSRFLVPKSPLTVSGTETKSLDGPSEKVAETRKQRNPFAPTTTVEDVIFIDEYCENCSSIDGLFALSTTEVKDEGGVSGENGSRSVTGGKQPEVMANVDDFNGTLVSRGKGEKNVARHVVCDKRTNTELSILHWGCSNKIRDDVSNQSDDCVIIDDGPISIELSDSSN
ncbi:hypothetical protein MOQ_006337 [Trypanosoma cruzi marinkellei]|uniref:Protein artemis n=1 Tax=Trypanosoma cruzi marinkellei TaxID=85056 RepID=K2NLV2_TRYCR|nr:hypothetical protein MOQ_006337 [Trypanosoma cruzi marinkellei]